jgi:hypothetical protein
VIRLRRGLPAGRLESRMSQIVLTTSMFSIGARPPTL